MKNKFLLLDMNLTRGNKTDSDSSSPLIQDKGVDVLKRFRLIFRAIQRYSQLVETSCGLSNAQLWAIWAIWEISQHPGIRVTELAKAMSIHQSTASNLLEKLVKKGMIRKNRISEDQRIVSLFITDDGMRALVLSPKPARGILQDALFNMSDSTLSTLACNLDELIDVMGIDDDSAAMQPINLFENNF
jgi:DNA-binding MarR family transcriptional regulator